MNLKALAAHQTNLKTSLSSKKVPQENDLAYSYFLAKPLYSHTETKVGFSVAFYFKNVEMLELELH